MIMLCVVFCVALRLHCASCDKTVTVDGDFYCKKGCAFFTSDSSVGCKKCKDVKDKGDCELFDEGHFGCQWKSKCKLSGCPVIAQKMRDMIKSGQHVSFDNKQHEYRKKVCENYGCLYSKKKESCSIMSTWALILIVDIVAIALIAAAVAIIVIIVLKTEKGTEKVGPSYDSVEEKQVSPNPVAGNFMVVKVGPRSKRTKVVNDGPELTWGENLVFANLGNEDDDAEIELWDQETQTQLAKGGIRLLSFREKTRVSVTLKDNSDVMLGVLEADIELKVDEETNPPGVSVEIFVDQFNKQ